MRAENCSVRIFIHIPLAECLRTATRRRVQFPHGIPFHFFCDANTGAGEDITGLAAVVQLRLRVANDYQGLQALQRCSGLLNRRARSITVATRHFADVAQQRQQQFCKLPGIAPRECESLRRPHFASVVKL